MLPQRVHVHASRVTRSSSATSDIGADLKLLTGRDDSAACVPARPGLDSMLPRWMVRWRPGFCGYRAATDPAVTESYPISCTTSRDNEPPGLRLWIVT